MQRSPDSAQQEEALQQELRQLSSPPVEASSWAGLDLQQVGAALAARRRFIVVFGSLVFAAVIVSTMFAHMSFSANGRLFLGELGSKSSMSGQKTDIDLGGGDDGDIGSEIAILTSDSLLRSAVLDSGLNAQVVPAGWTEPRYWEWRLSGRDRALLDDAGKNLRAVGARLFGDAVAPRSYHLVFQTPTEFGVFDPEKPGLLARGTLGEPVTLEGAEFTLVAGPAGEPETGSEFSVQVTPLQQTLQDVHDALDVTYPRPVSQNEMTKVISLDFVHSSPLVAASFLRILMNSYLKARQDWKMEDAKTAEQFVGQQLDAMRNSLDSTEQRMAEFRSTTAGVVLEGEADSMVEQIAKYEEQRVAARLEIAALADLKRAVARPDSPVEAYLFGEASDSVLQGMAASLTESRQVLTELETRFHGAAPNVKEARAQVEAHRRSIKKYVDSRLSRARANLSTFNTIIGDFQKKLQTVPGAERGLAQLSRESEVYSRLYSYLLERQQQAAIVKASNVSKNRILDEPQAPTKEASPKLALRILGALAGFLLAMGWVLLRRLTAGTLQSEAEARALAPALPVLASVPVPDGAVHKSAHDTLLAEPYSGFAEAFRLLRTNLYRLTGEGSGKIVVMTSPQPGDGKTTAAIALATMLAADRRRVLLIDADVRKPSHHELINVGHEGPGLSDLLSGRCRFSAAVQSHLTPFGAFDTISAGDATDPERLSEKAMREILGYARLHYEFIVVDTAAFPMVADALLMAPIADCAISVLRMDNTPRRLAVEHLQRINAVARTHAMVFNASGVGRAYGYSSAYAYGGKASIPTSTRPSLGLRLKDWLSPGRLAKLAVGVAALGVAVFFGLKEAELIDDRTPSDFAAAAMREAGVLPEDLGSGAAASQGVKAGDGVPGDLADPLAESPGAPGDITQADLPGAGQDMAVDGESMEGIEGDGEPAGGLEEDHARAPEQADVGSERPERQRLAARAKARRKARGRGNRPRDESSPELPQAATGEPDEALSAPPPPVPEKHDKDTQVEWGDPASAGATLPDNPF